MRYNPLKNPSERSQIHNIRRTTALFIVVFIVICLIAAFVLIWSVSDNNNGLFSLYSSTEQLEKQQEQKEEKKETKQDIAQEPEGVGISSSSFLEDEQKQQEQTNTTESTNTLDLTPDKEIDTSDWLTYRNEEYGFEFKYPGEFFSLPSEPTLGARVILKSRDDLDKNSRYYDTDISFFITPALIVAQDYSYDLAKANSLIVDQEQPIYPLNSVTHDSIPKDPHALKILINNNTIGYITKRIPEPDKPEQYVYFVYTQNTQTISDYILPVDITSYNLQAIDIINTLTFFQGTKQTPEIDTSDWLTYRNEEYGFEFKYPKEWQEGLWERQDPYQVDIIMSFDKLTDDAGYIMITQKSNLKENEPENSPLFSSKEEQQQYFREWNKKIYDEKYGYLTLEEWIGEDYIDRYHKIQLNNTYAYGDEMIGEYGFSFTFANKRNQIFKFYWGSIDNPGIITQAQIPYILKSFRIF